MHKQVMLSLPSIILILAIKCLDNSMTIIELHSAECKTCGHIMLMKPTMLSYNSLAPPPEDMDLSDTCEECGSSKIEYITHEEAMGKLKSLGEKFDD